MNQAQQKKSDGTNRLKTLIRKAVNETIDSELRPKGLPGIIATCFDRVESMIYSMDLYLGLARTEQEKNHERVINSLHKVAGNGFVEDQDTTAEILLDQLNEVMYGIGKLVRRNRRLLRIQLPDIVLRSFFLNLFSIYDAFSGDLLRWMYSEKPELAKAVQKTFTLSEAMAFEKISDFVKTVIEKEIDSFRRESHVEQFSSIETRFGLALTKFSAWSDFVECTQRRNLIMHTDGVVTTQYRDICGAHGVDITKTSIGSRLSVDSDYFYRSARLIQQVSFMLSHTLWRKLFDGAIAEADLHMREFLFDLLIEGNFALAIPVGEFCISQRKFSSDANRRVIKINYALALMHSGNSQGAIEVMNNDDWSSTIEDFRLANAVIRNDIDQVIELMHKIGASGEYISEEAYLEWPLFSSVRSNSQFQAAFESIFGKDLNEAVRADASSQASKQLDLIDK